MKNTLFLILFFIALDSFAQTSKKYTISPHGFLNRDTVADWTKQNGPASYVWWDMDGDGQSDKIYFEMDAKEFGLRIYKYNGNCFVKTINVNDLVSGDSLRILFDKVIQKSPSRQLMHTGASLNVVDFNKDQIPDLMFEFGTIESEIGISEFSSYDIILVSKGWLKYDMYTFPNKYHAQMTSCGDFNNDGYPDLWKSYSDSNYHVIKYFFKDFTSEDKLLRNLGRQDDQGTSYITDLDNNNIPDIVIGERDYNIDLGNGLPGKSPRIFLNVKNESWTNDISLYDNNFRSKWKVSTTRFQITQSIAFADLNKDGLKDIVVNKVHSAAAPPGQTSDGMIDSLRNETVIEVFENKGNGVFTDVTSSWFKNDAEYLRLPTNSAGPFYPPGGGNPNPGDLKMIDVDKDGQIDIAFVYYGNIYFKNKGNYFELQRNDNGFPFVSQSYRTITDPNFKLNSIKINGYLSILQNIGQTTISVDTAKNLDKTKWYKNNSLIGTSNLITLNSEGDYKVVRVDSIGCEYSQNFKIVKRGPVQVELKTFVFNADSSTISQGIGEIFPNLSEAVSGSNLFTFKGIEHIIGTPQIIPNKDAPPIHFINKNGSWEIEKIYKNVTLGSARNYVFIDSTTIALADHGVEGGNPWPYGDIFEIKLRGDTLNWKKLSKQKSFYHSVGAGDLNNDGLYDIIGLHMGSYNDWKGDGLHPYLQNKDSTFSEGQDLIKLVDGFYGSGALLVSDVMSDKRPEIIVGQYGTGFNNYGYSIYSFDSSSKMYTKKKTPWNTGIFLNSQQGATSIRTADFNKDGINDLAIASEGLPVESIQIWLGEGNGEFIPSQIINFPDVPNLKFPDSANQFREFEIEDVDNDGWIDILLNPFHYGNKFRINPGPNNKSSGWNGSGVYIQNQIWKNYGGYFNPLQDDLSVLGTYPGFIKGAYVNNRLKFFGFEPNGKNSVKLHEYKVKFCTTLEKPKLNTSKFSFCDGDSIKLSVINPTKGDSLKWFFNGKSDLTNIQSLTLKDSAKLYITKVDSAGCIINSDTISITKYSTPNKPQSVGTINYCQSTQAVALSATSNTGNNIIWYGNDNTGGTPSSSAPIPSTSKPGITDYYYSQVTSNTGCESPRAKITVKVNQTPDKPIFNTSKFSFCSGDSLKLSITNVNKGDTLKWYFGTKSDLTNIANKTFTDSSKVIVTRTDSLGCMISSDTIQLKKYAIPGSPSLVRDTANNLIASINGITWYKDGVKIADTTQKIKPTTNGIFTATTTQNGCTSSISQGYYYLTNAVSNLSNGEYFKISPNPTSGELNINYKISSSRNISISVFDINGRAVLLNKKVESGSKVNLGSISKGNYIIQIKDGSGRLITSQKLVKE